MLAFTSQMIWLFCTLLSSLFIVYFVTDICCNTSETRFAVLALLNYSDKPVPTEKDGMVLLFDAENPIPVSTWFVRKVLSNFFL
jgi:hypothetical protein